MTSLGEMMRISTITEVRGYWIDDAVVPVEIDNIVFVTKDAALFDIGDDRVWIPLSQLEYANKKEGTMYVSFWIAKEKGLI